MATYQPPKKNTAWIGYISLVSQASTLLVKVNPTLASGDFKVSIDGGALANLATLPTVTPASGPMVKVSLSSSEMNGDNITVVCSDAAGAEWCDLVFNLQTAARQIDDLAFPATSGRSIVVDAAGLVDANTVKVGPTGSGTAQTARDVGASVLLSPGTGTGQLDFNSGVVKANLAQILGTALTETAGLIAAGFKQFFNIASPTSTMNTITVVTTATNLTNAPSDSSGTTTLLSRLSSTRAGYLDNLSAGAVALASSLSTLAGKFTGITLLSEWLGLIAGKQTGNSTARTEMRATGVGSGTYDETTDSQEALKDDQMTAADLENSVWDATMASHLTSGTTGASLNGAGAAGDPWTTSLPGAYGAGTAGKIIGDNITGNAYTRLGAPAGASVSADVAAIKTDTGNLVTRITSTLFSGITSLAQWLGAIAGKQVGNSTARTEIRATGAGFGTFDETTDSQEALRDNMGTVQTGDSYARLGAPAGASVSADIAAAKADTAAIKAKTDSLTFTVAGMADANVVDWKGTTAPAMTGDAFARLGAAGAGLTALGDTRIAHLDADVSSRLPTSSYTTPLSAGATANAVWNEPTSGHSTAGTTGKALTDAGAAGTPLDAAGVRAAVGLASANLDTQLAAGAQDATVAKASALSTAQTAITAIKAKTDSLAFTVANQLDANVQYVNDVQVNGTGTPGNEWGP